MDTTERSGGQASTSGRPHDGPGPRQLVALALQVHNGFNSAQLTLDSHTDAALAELRVEDPDAQTFVKQVVYGMVRYRKFFGCLLDAFYHRNRCARRWSLGLGGLHLQRAPATGPR
jgi:hypothetical protein